MIIRNGLIVTAERQFKADIRIQDEKIKEIDQDLPKDEEDDIEINAKGLLILPGGIDPHVHLSLPDSVPKLYHWADDFTSGSEAALAGGITSLGNISVPDVGEPLLAILERETKCIREQAIADIMIHPVIHSPTESTLQDIPLLVTEGCTSIKIFMCTDDFDKHVLKYLKAIQLAGEVGIIPMLHCEDWSIISLLSQRMCDKGQDSLYYYPESRPLVSEVVATQRAVAMCETTGTPIYIVHLSSEGALQVCEEAQARELPVYVETRPIFLYLTRERYSDSNGALYVVQPPLREEHDIEALWKGMKKGSIHTFATDHAPHTQDQKLDPSLNIMSLCPGINELQLMLPMFHSEGVLKGRITLQQFVALSSTNVAKLFGLFPRKGAIAINSDADLVLWDPSEKREINKDDMLSRAGFSIYEGKEVTGWPKITIRRGEIVYKKEKVIGFPGSGQVLRRGRTQTLNKRSE